MSFRRRLVQARIFHGRHVARAVIDALHPRRFGIRQFRRQEWLCGLIIEFAAIFRQVWLVWHIFRL
jgi:hypothetical protein